MDRQIKPIFEFIAWDNCNNNCCFCWQKKQQKCSNLKAQIDSLQMISNFIDSSEFKQNSHILLVGGEIFDNIDKILQQKIIEFYNKIIDKQISNKVDILYINTNLLYENLDTLKTILSSLSSNNLLDRVRFTTSYDIYGRFSNESRQELFLKNIERLKTSYPKLNIVINSILTKHACQDILKNDISFFDRLMHDNYVNLIPYISINKIDELKPDKDILFKTLNKINNRYEDYVLNNIKNLDLPQEKIIYRYINGKLTYSSALKNEKCNHGINFSKYSNSNSCYICDVKSLFNIE